MSVSEREVYIVIAEVYRFNIVPGYTIGFQRGFHFSKHRQIVPSKKYFVQSGPHFYAQRPNRGNSRAIPVGSTLDHEMPVSAKDVRRQDDVIRPHVPHLCTFNLAADFIFAADICLTSLPFIFYPPPSLDPLLSALQLCPS